MKPTLRTATLLSLALLAGLTLLTPPPAQGQINYQGTLTDTIGAPLPDGQYDIYFSLYNQAAAGGTQNWGYYIADGQAATTGHGPKVDLVNGRFNVIIGGTDSSGRSLTTAMTSSATQYLEIYVASGPAQGGIYPRQVILPAPRALSADVIPNITPVGPNTSITGNVGITGKVEIGPGFADAKLQANVSSTDAIAAFRVRVDNSSKLTVGSNGGTSIGALDDTPPANGLYVSGNVGIGTSNPNAKLDVHGDIKLGPTGQYFAPSGEENLRIVRGVVNADGSTAQGTGFSVEPGGSNGNYIITFTNPFSGPPAVTAATSDTYSSWNVSTLSTDQVYVVTWDYGVGGVQHAFSFIAIGPR